MEGSRNDAPKPLCPVCSLIFSRRAPALYFALSLRHSLFVSSCIKTLRSVRYRHILNKAPSELCPSSIARRMPAKLPIEVLSLPFALTLNVWHLAEA